MTFLSRIRTQAMSWWQGVPLPAAGAGLKPIFQSWHEFDQASIRWCQVEHGQGQQRRETENVQADSHPLRLVTWNVDSGSPLPGPRIDAILSHILNLSPAVDIIFLQELCGAAISRILEDHRVRRNWYLSDTDNAIPDGQSFMTMTLLSKSRFGHPAKTKMPQSTSLGTIWRIKYPSRYGRDALCCDIFVSSPSSSSAPTSRVRLINVHLDSLPIQPSRRPQQVSVVSSLLQSAGRGIVAGDFNPVLPEDANLVQDHGLVDAWEKLRPDDPGFTWGVDGEQPFPPNRMDKVAAVGLQFEGIEVHHPATVGRSTDGGNDDRPEQSAEELVPWSDHSGLSCTFGLPVEG